MASKWTIELVLEAEASVEAEKIQRLANEPAKDILRDFLSKVMTETDEDSALTDANRVAYALASIILITDHAPSLGQQLPKLERIVHSLLLRNRVKPRRSQLGHLYRQLAENLAYYKSQQGETTEALWELAKGHILSQGSLVSPHAKHLLLQAELTLDARSASAAAGLFQKASEISLDPISRVQAQLSSLQALRLSGQLMTARKKLEELTKSHPSVTESPAYHWERLMLIGGTLSPEQWLRSEGYLLLREQPILTLRIALWAYAELGVNQQAATLRKLQRLKNLLKKLSLRPKQKAALRAWDILDTLYDSTIPFELRLTHATHLHSLVKQLMCEEHQLCLLALGRWLVRHSQPQLAHLIEEEHRGIQLRLQLTDLVRTQEPEEKMAEPLILHSIQRPKIEKKNMQDDEEEGEEFEGVEDDPKSLPRGA